LMLMAGASVAYAENMDTIPINRGDVRPTVMLGVPRFFEKLYMRIQEGIQQAPTRKRRIVEWAFAVGRATAPSRLTHRPISPWLWCQEQLAQRLVFHTFHQRLGGRLRFFVSGSAPLSKPIAEFFYSAHVIILEGYGLTETSPVICVNRPGALKFGTVGLPINGVDVKLAEDGEILTSGPHVMQGYYRQPGATQTVIREGWCHTGDIGTIDAEGFVSITDRKKDLIKTAGGKFVAPQKLEGLFLTDPAIAQAFVYGDREPYCIALIIPRFERLADYAKDHGLPSEPQALVQSSLIRDFLWGRVQALQQHLPSFEQIKAIALLDKEFTQAAGELTPTLKAKRAAIAMRYQALIRTLYQQGAQNNPSVSASSCR
ncbi:MAG: AMP-binding protein, partial [Candidatus Omnitrophica bacterium]|nr:AMP-binding protein [Candidatus Omnitrophota bacterium]